MPFAKNDVRSGCGCAERRSVTILRPGRTVAPFCVGTQKKWPFQDGQHTNAERHFAAWRSSRGETRRSGGTCTTRAGPSHSPAKRWPARDARLFTAGMLGVRFLEGRSRQGGGGRPAQTSVNVQLPRQSLGGTRSRVAISDSRDGAGPRSGAGADSSSGRLGITDGSCGILGGARRHRTNFEGRLTYGADRGVDGTLIGFSWLHADKENCSTSVATYGLPWGLRIPLFAMSFFA